MDSIPDSWSDSKPFALMEIDRGSANPSVKEESDNE